MGDRCEDRGKDLPVMPPVSPMLAKSIPEVLKPEDIEGGLLYEPKWDGFGRR